jgi:hypothetical protein
MHPALFIHEIRLAVAQDIAGEDRTDLVALALSCQAFSEPALDLLWQAPQPIRLAMRMKDELWTVRDEEGEIDVDYEESYEEDPFRETKRVLVSLHTRMHFDGIF